MDKKIIETELKCYLFDDKDFENLKDKDVITEDCRLISIRSWAKFSRFIYVNAMVRNKEVVLYYNRNKDTWKIKTGKISNDLQEKILDRVKELCLYYLKRTKADRYLKAKDYNSWESICHADDYNMYWSDIYEEPKKFRYELKPKKFKYEIKLESSFNFTCTEKDFEKFKDINFNKVILDHLRNKYIFENINNVDEKYEIIQKTEI